MTVAGTSAGASILCEHMIAFGDEGSSAISGSVPLAPGLGLTNRVIIDQHFRQRDRLGRLLTALAYNPFAVGIGLDEDTAAFIGPDETVEVVGSGGVTIVDATDVSFSSMDAVSEGQPVCMLGLKLHILIAGATFNLHTRRGAGRDRSIVPKELAASSTQRRKPGMRILDRSVYVGPSLYAHFPVIRLDLDLGALEQWPTGRLGAAFIDGLPAALPGLAEHGCSYGEPGGFVRRMREDEGTWLGHVLEHVAIELQNIAGENVTFGKTRAPARRASTRRLRVRAARRRPRRRRTRRCACCARCCPTRSAPRTACPKAGAGPRRATSSSASRSAARSARRPRRWCAPPRRAASRGCGSTTSRWSSSATASYQQRIQATVTSRTPHIAVELATDKEETNKILATLGLPVPQQELVQTEGQAVRAARRIGYPVVVKPYNANHGRGVSIHLTTDEEVARASRSRSEHSRSVIVESFLDGDDHRMLVVNGELVAATRRAPGHVVGDGAAHIAQLVEIVNQDPRRGVGHEKVLTRLELDTQARSCWSRPG